MIGVVGPDSEAEALADALDRLDARPRAGTAEEVAAASPDAILAIGEPAAIELARAGATAPVLPVAAGRGLGSLPFERAVDALERVIADDYGTCRHPILDVRLGEERVGRALFDVMLVTGEPGRISEYGIAAPEPVDRFRADGVVVATPAGSYGYANAAGGPLLSRGGDLLAVVPVAAFAIRPDHWVFDLGAPLVLSVERDEGDVSLLLDDRERRGVPHDRPIELRADGALEAIVLDGET